MKDHAILRVSKYGFLNQSFTARELITNKIIDDKEWSYIDSLLDTTNGSSTNPNAIAKVLSKNDSLNKQEWTFALLPSTVFSYIDHMELQEARNNAREARRFSYWAILISILSIMVQIIFN